MGRFLVVLAIICLYCGLSAQASAAPPLRVAIDAPYPPFADYDHNGELTGFDVDIARALCAELARECDIRAVNFTDIIPAIVAGKIDIAVAGMGATEERKKQVDFTDRYYRSLSIFIEIPGTVEDTGVEALKGRRVGAQKGTIQADYLRQAYGDNIKLAVTESYDDLMEMLRAGKLDLALVDGLPGYAYLKSEQGRGLETVGKPVASNNIRDLACIAVSKKQPELREALNKAIQTLRRNGEYGKINRKYFDFVVY